VYTRTFIDNIERTIYYNRLAEVLLGEFFQIGRYRIVSLT